MNAKLLQKARERFKARVVRSWGVRCVWNAGGLFGGASAWAGALNERETASNGAGTLLGARALDNGFF